MKKLSVVLLFVVVNTLYCVIAEGVTKPRYALGVETLGHSHQYIRHHIATMYWKISPYYVSQQTDSSCSPATASMIVNAARSNQHLAANQPLATENGILRQVKSETWSKEVRNGGDGVTLDEFKTFMEKALNAYGVYGFTITTVHLKDTSSSNALRLHKALLETEKTGNTFIIANFNQKFFTEAMSVGHFSPVAAYDKDTQKVLMMDPDREFYEPYWIPEELLLKSMATIDQDAKAYRGYLLVTLSKPSSVLNS